MKGYHSLQNYRNISHVANRNNASLCLGKLDDSDALCLVEAAFYTYAVQMKHILRVIFLTSKLDIPVGDQLHPSSALSSLLIAPPIPPCLYPPCVLSRIPCTHQNLELLQCQQLLMLP